MATYAALLNMKASSRYALTHGYCRRQDFKHNRSLEDMLQVDLSAYNIYTYIHTYIDNGTDLIASQCGTSSAHIQGPSLRSLLATGKVVLGISWSESMCCVTFVCSS